MCLSSLSGCELTSLSNALSILLSENLNSEEIAILAAFFTSLGDNLALIALQQ